MVLTRAQSKATPLTSKEAPASKSAIQQAPRRGRPKKIKEEPPVKANAEEKNTPVVPAPKKANTRGRKAVVQDEEKPSTRSRIEVTKEDTMLSASRRVKTRAKSAIAQEEEHPVSAPAKRGTRATSKAAVKSVVSAAEKTTTSSRSKAVEKKSTAARAKPTTRATKSTTRRKASGKSAENTTHPGTEGIDRELPDELEALPQQPMRPGSGREEEAQITSPLQDSKEQGSALQEHQNTPTDGGSLEVPAGAHEAKLTLPNAESATPILKTFSIITQPDESNRSPLKLPPKSPGKSLRSCLTDSTDMEELPNIKTPARKLPNAFRASMVNGSPDSLAETSSFQTSIHATPKRPQVGQNRFWQTAPKRFPSDHSASLFGGPRFTPSKAVADDAGFRGSLRIAPKKIPSAWKEVLEEAPMLFQSGPVSVSLQSPLRKTPKKPFGGLRSAARPTPLKVVTEVAEIHSPTTSCPTPRETVAELGALPANTVKRSPKRKGSPISESPDDQKTLKAPRYSITGRGSDASFLHHIGMPFNTSSGILSGKTSRNCRHSMAATTPTNLFLGRINMPLATQGLGTEEPPRRHSLAAGAPAQVAPKYIDILPDTLAQVIGSDTRSVQKLSPLNGSTRTPNHVSAQRTPRTVEKSLPADLLVTPPLKTAALSLDVPTSALNQTTPRETQRLVPEKALTGTPCLGNNSMSFNTPGGPSTAKIIHAIQKSAPRNAEAESPLLQKIRLPFGTPTQASTTKTAHSSHKPLRPDSVNETPFLEQIGMPFETPVPNVNKKISDSSCTSSSMASSDQPSSLQQIETPFGNLAPTTSAKLSQSTRKSTPATPSGVFLGRIGMPFESPAPAPVDTPGNCSRKSLIAVTPSEKFLAHIKSPFDILERSPQTASRNTMEYATPQDSPGGGSVEAVESPTGIPRDVTSEKSPQLSGYSFTEQLEGSKVSPGQTEPHLCNRPELSTQAWAESILATSRDHLLVQDPSPKVVYPELPTVQDPPERPTTPVKQLTIPYTPQLAATPRPILSPKKSALRTPAPGATSPKKTVTWDLEPLIPRPSKSLLAGTVFYVDVHTADGSNHSNLFVPLLQEMGATCVDSWPHSNTGITHVLFKDGDTRTLEKVVASAGAVKCVNIGWALDCERFNARMSESKYLIDLSHVPGSAHTSPTKAKPLPLASIPPNTPPPRTPSNRSLKFTLQTPTFSLGIKPLFGGAGCSPVTITDKENFSPASLGAEGSPSTPYFLRPEEILQRTCPAKQSRRGLIEAPEREEEKMMATPFKARLLAAKRMSLGSALMSSGSPDRRGIEF